jgi:hypothetical protein
MNSKQPHEQGAGLPPPRRAVERDYLAALADLVPLDTWREICQTTVEAAKAGDPKARDWLARYLLGPEPLKLLAVAADEAAGFSTADLIDRECDSREMIRILSRPS